MIKIKQENLISRPPIVVVLGHVDHGKSSLLEAIKDFKITAKESGGITQHIGAYQVEENGKKITFIDTPGHEAFSQMRSRGAKVADIAILVIDASESIKPQTKEAISHIKQSEIPMIVALNKMDKPEADPEKVKRELSKEDVLVESMGGEIPSVEVSAKTGDGIPDLLSLITLIAEIDGLKTDYQKLGEGVIIESYLDNNRGPTATLLLTAGIIKIGDIIGTLSAFVKVKNLEDFQGNLIKEAFPSTPVIIFGFDKVPRVGEAFKVFLDLESAKINSNSLENKIVVPKELLKGQKVLNIILKTDVAGTAEAIEGILAKLPQDKIILNIIKSEAGNINESDLKVAKGGRAIVLGFRVKVDFVAKSIAERERIKIMTFDVIYELVEGTRKFMEKILSPEDIRIDFGKVKVLARFLAEKNRQIIGGKVIDGDIKKNASIEVLRREEVIGKGRLINLQKNKKDTDSIPRGEECGILFEGDVKVEEGDILVAYRQEKKKGEL